jgi:bifunctional DNA-binding transcriptional regulator/antitoxin component of YhaV-PrlF toxin-antitoxin module
MLLSRLTTKGQTTIPQEACTALDLQDGDRIRYTLDGKRLILTKLTPPVVGKEDAGIPDEVRASLGLQDGDHLSYSVEGDKVVVTKLPPINCSFCGKALERPQPPSPGLPRPPALVVAGPRSFICRDCVGLCISIFAESDPQWRDRKIEHLTGFATGETQKKLEARKEELLARVNSAQNGESKTDLRDTPPHEETPPKD